MKKNLSLILILFAATLVLQSFQCGSKEMTTAKVAMKSQDWPKAEASLKKELQKNESNGEALILLAEVQDQLGKPKDAAETIKLAESKELEPKYKQQIPAFVSKIWSEAYNRGFTQYLNYFDTKDTKYLDSALYEYDIAIYLRPERRSFWSMKGNIYEAKSDTLNAIKAYKEYVRLTEQEITLAKDKGLFLNMKREDALNILGKPDLSKGASYSNGDSALTDIYMNNNVPIILSSNSKKNGPFIIDGWRINPPQNWSQFEYIQLNKIETNPFAALAQIYYERKEYDNSLKYVKILNILEPANEDFNNFMIDLYKVQNKTDEAIKTVDMLTKKSPDNKYYWAQYGDILLFSKKYDEAIEKYQKAIAIDKTFYSVYKNAASAYKNKAALMQKAQQDKKMNDKNYKEDPSEYAEFLEKSADYFSKARQDAELRNNIYIIGELINIHEVLDKKDVIMRYVGELEGLEYTIDAKDKEEYYRILCKTFSNLKMSDKMEKACTKYNELTK